MQWQSIALKNFWDLKEKQGSEIMSEQKKFPKFEDGLKDFLSSEALKNALDFVDYLKMNKIAVEFSGHENVWHVRYLNKHICVIVFYDNSAKPVCFVDGINKSPVPWTIFWGDYDEYEHKDIQVDECFRKFIWTCVHICEKCPCNNKMEICRTIFGKEYKNLCHCSLAFTNPDAEALEHIKTLLEMRKLYIDDIQRLE